MHLQRVLISVVLAGLSCSAMAEPKYQKVDSNFKEMTLFMDVNSIQPKVDQYKNRYLEATFVRAYASPKKMETQNKYYTHLHETLSVVCLHGAYASSNWRWNINGKTIHRSAGKGDDWNKYDSSDRSTNAISARALCKHYKSFLG